MEHRVVRLIDLIGSIDASQCDNSHRRRLVFHYSNLNRAGLTSEQQRSASGFRRCGQIEVVEWIAGRMVQRNIQSVKVVVLVLNLWSVGHGETKTTHDFGQFGNGLRNRM